MSPPKGRPSDYTPEVADKICERLSNGESLRSICRDDAMPSQSMVFRWVAARPDFREQYARAREALMEHYADEIIEIADDSRGDSYTDENGNERTNQEVVGRARLRVDTRKWLMSKLAPKKYGDKLEHSGTVALRHEDAVAILEREEREQSGGTPAVSE